MGRLRITRWLRHGAFPCPALSHSVVYHAERNRTQPTGLRQTHNRSIDGYANGISPIVALHFWGSPYAIVWTVPKMVVHSLNGVFGRWFQSHISKEILKRAPSFADCNAATSIFMKVLAASIQTAISHAVPATIFRRCFASLRVSVRFDNAPTAFRVAVRKMIRVDQGGISAITSAPPLWFSKDIVGAARQCDQSSVSLICPIYKPWHRRKLSQPYGGVKWI